jgi:hypothetical protein
MRFAPEYIACVLNENFEDAKRLFLLPLMAIHYAHLVMLADTRIIGPFDARRLREALFARQILERGTVPRRHSARGMIGLEAGRARVGSCLVRNRAQGAR